VLPGGLSLLHDAALLRFPAAPAGTGTNEAGGTPEEIAAAGELLARNTATAPHGGEAESGNAGPAATAGLHRSDADRLAQALLAEAAPAETASLPGGGAAAPAGHDSALAIGPEGSEANQDAPAEQPTAPAQHISVRSIANPFAAEGLANQATQNQAASYSAPPPVAPRAVTPSAMQHGVSGTADASAAQATPLAPQSQIAFQAELQLNQGQHAANPSPSGPRGDAPAHRAVPESASADAAAIRARHPEANALAARIETGPAAAYRKAEHSDTGSSSFSQDHSAANLDRGAQQTMLLSQGPNGPATRPAGEGAVGLRPPSTTAAAQLDAVAPPTPPETGAARSVALKIHSEQHGTANVVLTDRGGQVQVTVRSSDPALTQSLRGDLGSLAGGLQQHGFDVKIWSPSSNSAANHETRAGSTEFSSQDDVSGQPRQRHSADDADPRRQRRGEWTEEFD
jgi:hypothetical protein